MLFNYTHTIAKSEKIRSYSQTNMYVLILNKKKIIIMSQTKFPNNQYLSYHFDEFHHLKLVSAEEVDTNSAVRYYSTVEEFVADLTTSLVNHLTWIEVLPDELADNIVAPTEEEWDTLYMQVVHEWIGRNFGKFSQDIFNVATYVESTPDTIKKSNKKTSEHRISDIIKCSKWSFSNGEKAIYSGCMNHWVKEETKTGNHVYDVSWYFLYKQPVTYFLEEWMKPLPKRQQVQACLRPDKYGRLMHVGFPFYAYGQRITAWCISGLKVEAGACLYMVSGDDDIVFVRFPAADINKVKSFIKDTALTTLSPATLSVFVKENGYEFE